MEKCSCSVESCIKQCKQGPLILLIAGAVLFILGLVMDAGLLKLLWLILTAAVTGAGGYFYWNVLQKKKETKE